MNNNLKKANLIIYLQSLLQFQGFIGPVIFIFYTKYMGLNTSQYLFCDSLLFLIMSVCEVPSGLISDYVGRKKDVNHITIVYLFRNDDFTICS